MAITPKPQFDVTWAETGTKVQPTDAKIAQGWTVERPPYQFMNWQQNRVEQMVQHINQAGIAIWDQYTNYTAGQSYVQGSDGVLYQASVDSVNQDPTSTTGFWVVWSDAVAQQVEDVVLPQVETITQEKIDAFSDNLASSSGAGLVGTSARGGNSADITILDKVQQIPSITDYVNSDGDQVSPAIADNATGIQRAIDANLRQRLDMSTGTYSLFSQLLISAQMLQLVGRNRVDTTLRNNNAESNSTIRISGPDAGVIQDLGFQNSLNTGAQIEIIDAAHMWALNRLLFRGLQGPAIYVDNCWDMFWHDLDALSPAQNGAADPAVGAALVVGSGVNNLHIDGWRCEKPINAGVYWAGGGYITGGKIDRGFAVTPTQPCMIVSGSLGLSNFFITGSSDGQADVLLRDYANFEDSGSIFDGGIGGANELVTVAFARRHSILSTDSESFYGPRSGIARFRGSRFNARHRSVSSVTSAAVGGKTASNTYVQNVAVASRAYNGTNRYTAVFLTGITYSRNNWADRCTLVNATTGKRYFILSSYATGELRLYGDNLTTEITVGAKYRIEYMPQEADRVEFSEACVFSQQIAPLAVYAARLSVTGASFDSATCLTSATLSGTTLTGFTGYFLFNRANNKQYRIESHAGGVLTLNGDVSSELGSGLFDVVFGAYIPASVSGGHAEWMSSQGRRRIALSALRDQGRSVDEIYPEQDGVLI